MWLGTRHPRLRCASVWFGVTVGAFATAAVVLVGPGPAPVLGRRPATLDLALAEGSAWVVLGCALWLWLTTTVAVVQALRGCPPAARSGLRRWVLLACGVAAVSGSVPAAAVPPGHHVPAATALPYPDRAVARPEVAPARPPRTVVVRPGDSLWVIAARDLAGSATDAAVSARWHALYAANRAAIGPDPDRIRPGLRLLLPGKDPS